MHWERRSRDGLQRGRGARGGREIQGVLGSPRVYCWKDARCGILFNSQVRTLVSKDGATYACKIISKEKSSTIYRVKFLPRELKILGSTKHPHITQIFTIIEEPTKVFIIMEMACGGDLLEKILKVKRLDEKTTHQFFMQLASALAYLHKNDVAHRDLKCENVLLTTVDVVKLTDFSFARYCTGEDKKRKELSETFCGSEAYAAPEILQGICYLPKLADVWSLGVILYVMVTGLLPYESNGLLRQVRLQMTRMVLPLSSELKNLIRGMLEPVVALRASMGRVIRHPWIKRYPSPFKEINRKVYAYEASQQRARLESLSTQSAPSAPKPGAGLATGEAGDEDADSQSSDTSSLRDPVRQEAKEDVSVKEDVDLPKVSLGRHRVTPDAVSAVLKSMCDSGQYHLTDNNCQEWVLELLHRLDIKIPEDSPPAARRVVREAAGPLALFGASLLSGALLLAGLLGSNGSRRRHAQLRLRRF
ncbi:testis-specific serine/threonine-protein kinase 6-like isoform X4 [Dermacentor albipictus]|uniref:testis-specific serine/threonine-protein kinase 6-like isoform X4 n=1 Tax=Dermacentor albipictus TaxID=60249 RepID=UPI0038FC475D